MNSNMDSAERSKKKYLVEHLDPELGPWSALEYASIAAESSSAGALFCLSSVSHDLEIPSTLRNTIGFACDQRSVEELYKDSKNRVCLLDPAAASSLSPEDGEAFDVFLFGGILGTASWCRRTSS